jgi:hypothetical protein
MFGRTDTCEAIYEPNMHDRHTFSFAALSFASRSSPLMDASVVCEMATLDIARAG